MRESVVAVILAVVAVVSACGNDQPTIPSPIASRLSSQVDAIRQAATAGDRQGAERRLGELRQAVGQLRAAGEVSEVTASRLLARAAVVESALAALPTTTTSSEPPRVQEEDKDRDRDKKEDEEED